MFPGSFYAASNIVDHVSRWWGAQLTSDVLGNLEEGFNRFETKAVRGCGNPTPSDGELIINEPTPQRISLKDFVWKHVVNYLSTNPGY